MLRCILFAILLSAFSCQINAQENHRMKTYYLVLLKKGPNRNEDSLTVSQLQAAHIAHLDKMHAEKRLCLAGPMGVSHDIRGICIYNTATLEEAVKYANEDPAVISGRLIAEVIPWMSESGHCLP